MNEVLQRRLAGALVLFALVFVLASLLPDARPPARHGGAQVVTYDLGTGLPLDPALVTAGNPGGTHGAAETPDVPASQPRTAIQLRESPVLGSIKSWFVQVGSFESEANARSVLVKLQQSGLPTAIQPVQVGKVLWYRVRIGPYPGEDQAQDVLGAIRRQGYGGAKLIRPGS